MSLQNINNLKKFENFIGNDPKMQYVEGRGRKFKHSYSLNQISYHFKKCIPLNPTKKDLVLIQNIKTKLYELDKQSLTSLAKKAKVSKCTFIHIQFRQRLGNWWFKLTTGFDRREFIRPDRIYGETVANLMDKFTRAWDKDTGNFQFSTFDLLQFTKLIHHHADLFKKPNIDPKIHFGFIEKYDLNPAFNPQIFIRADLHGDLKSLIEDVLCLQKQGLLDLNFKCKPGVHLQFLGDYVDRGAYGTQILEMLLRLKEENPTQVHLIRGNHEYPELSLQYCETDPFLKKAQEDPACREALERFYQTMPLSTYFSVDSGKSREYMQCTHGTFEPTMDPAPLLDTLQSGDYLAVPKQRKLSHRIKKIANGNSKLATSAKRIVSIVRNSNYLEPELTVYNWGDVANKHSQFGPLSYRDYRLCGQDIRHYLDLSSENHKVIMLFRGHEHFFQHVKDRLGQVVATTLPVGMDCPAYKDCFDQLDRAYIITPKSKVANWEKRALLRKSGHDHIDEVTKSHSLTSDAI